MSALLFIDTETTGLNKEKHALIEIGAIAVIDGEIVGEFCCKMKPHDGALIDPEALKINGYIRSEIDTWGNPKQELERFIEWVDSHERKFSLAGHNIKFDNGFLRSALCRSGMYGELVTRFKTKSVDTYLLAKEIGKKKIRADNFKLGTLCEYFEIKLENAHTAMADIRATYQLYCILETMVPKLIDTEITASYQQKRRLFLDSKYITRNADGSVYLTEEWAKNKQIREFILTELWDLETD